MSVRAETEALLVAAWTKVQHAENVAAKDVQQLSATIERSIASLHVLPSDDDVKAEPAVDGSADVVKPERARKRPRASS